MTRRIFLSSSIRLVLVCKPAGGIDEHDVDLARLRRREHRRTRPTTDRRPRAPRTNSAPLRSAQIASCSAAAARNVSAATNITRLPCDDKCAAQLADRRRLAAAVDADHEHDGRLAPRARCAPPGKRQERAHVVLETRDGLVAAAPALLPGHRPQAVENLLRGRHAEIGRDQHLFEFIPERVVERTLRWASVSTPASDSRDRPRAALELREPTHSGLPFPIDNRTPVRLGRTARPDSSAARAERQIDALPAHARVLAPTRARNSPAYRRRITTGPRGRDRPRR